MSLPGDVLKLRSDGSIVCEMEDCTNAAAKSVCTESDSFGDEFTSMCEKHVEEFANSEPALEICEWCNVGPIEVHPIRDFEEGSHGPVYEVCNACIAKQNKLIAEEADYYDSHF